MNPYKCFVAVEQTFWFFTPLPIQNLFNKKSASHTKFLPYCLPIWHVLIYPEKSSFLWCVKEGMDIILHGTRSSYIEDSSGLVGLNVDREFQAFPIRCPLFLQSAPPKSRRRSIYDFPLLFLSNRSDFQNQRRS